MKNMCYNKGTKKKERNKKCFYLSKNKVRTVPWTIKFEADKGRQSAAGTRRKNKGKEGIKSDDSFPL